MQHPIVSAWLAMLGVGLIALFSPAVVAGALALTVVGVAALWHFGRCRHEGRPGLLPPSTQPDGTRTPARWFCGQCGKVWDADFRRESTPVQRYAGFDQSKLPAAAKRAAALERERQHLAMRRAGIAAGKATTARTAAPAPVSTIVSIERGRRTVVSS
ncbi:MAG: hypothetical protein IT184_11935 [Acidobacteria bacterium]|nr:hypothetical protein [Acidobacteriota bacterium]